MAQCWTEYHQITDQILLAPPPLILIMQITSTGLGKYQYHIDNKNEEKNVCNVLRLFLSLTGWPLNHTTPTPQPGLPAILPNIIQIYWHRHRVVCQLLLGSSLNVNTYLLSQKINQYISSQGRGNIFWNFSCLGHPNPANYKLWLCVTWRILSNHAGPSLWCLVSMMISYSTAASPSRSGSP